MELPPPQDRVVDENSLESRLEVPADIDDVKDLFWRLEDLSSFRPTPQQWRNQYFPLLNVYTERMRHKPNQPGFQTYSRLDGFWVCLRDAEVALETAFQDDGHMEQ
jgi:hypothetical protein